jgi:DegV family protein with EDD domain
MSIQIVTDTGCDLPAELVEQHNIHLVPLILRLGERELLDTDTSRQELWQHVEAGLSCQTSGPPIGAYEVVYRPLVEAGHEVLCITLTGTHSVTYNSAWAAAQAFAGQVTVVDSRSLSLGYGVLVLKAAQLAGQGANMATIVAAIQEMRQRTEIRFFLESVDQLQRGGRLDSLMPLLNRLGQALSIRAMLTVNDEGRISLIGPARGRRGAIKRLIQDAVATVPIEQAIVVHARCPEDAAEVADRLSTQLGVSPADIMVVELGAVLIAHAGAGTLGVGTVAAKRNG